MTKRALCVGINAYPNAPLSGCVNDARDWTDLLASKGYEVATYIEGAAEKATILDLLGQIVELSRWGDRIVFTYSGHGSWIPDMSGDEPDGRDEVLCAIDYEAGGYITDDELADVFARRRRGVRVSVFSDSCHSGSVTRLAELLSQQQPATRIGRLEARRPRYVDPSTFLTRPEEVRRIPLARVLEDATTPRTSAGTVLFSGCSDEEYSYDAFINGRWNGAFTQTAMWAFATLGDPTYRAWHKLIRSVLPSDDYPQSPNLYASLWQRGWRL